MDSATDSMESLFGKADGIQLGGSILAVTAMITGAVMLVLGFKLIRAALFVIGVVVGGVAIAMIVERMFRDETWVALASWIAFGAGGVLCGAVATWLYPVSAFFAGAATGVMTAMILTNSFGYMIYPGHTKDLLTLACVVLGILFGALALKVGKPVLIISTSLFGSGMVVWGVGYFTGGFPSANDLEQYASEDIEGKIVYSVPAAWWGYLAGILVLFVFGMYIQFRKTARNVKHQRSKVFGKSMEVAEYIEKKTQRNRNQNSPVMEMPYRQQPRRQMRVREQRQPRHVREVHETREQQVPKKKRAEKQHPPHSIARHPYPDLDAADEIITDSSCCSEKIVRIER
ncbi:Transmembrane protein [Phytophthora cinnamomi]|uniref:Transmembrane protein n=1 Tax=Phytophthora cinnamomi TaxID=4785 RepID=UPI003559A23B|nr:Transmembrane protein [Phytophthora cinnamomi]